MKRWSLWIITEEPKENRVDVDSENLFVFIFAHGFRPIALEREARRMIFIFNRKETEEIIKQATSNLDVDVHWKDAQLGKDQWKNGLTMIKDHRERFGD